MQGYNQCMPHLTRPLLRLLPAALALACSAAGAAPAADPPAFKEPPEPKVEQITVQDKDVRIDELRVRGQTRSLTVKPRNAPEYEVLPIDPGKPIDDKTEGRRVWRLFQF